MTLLLSDSDVRALASMEDCVGAIERSLVEQHEGAVVMPPRLNLTLDATFLRLMPVQLGASGIMGYKTFHGSMSDGVRYLVVLCRISDGEILALVDAAYLTAFRTGATSGVATRHLARTGPAGVAVIGSGLEAETNLRAVAAVREVTGVKVFSPRPERRTSFADRMSAALTVEVEPVDSPQVAVDGADIVVVATNTGTNGPIAFEGAWMQAGQHVVTIGATSPFLREVDAATFDRADRVVFDVPVEQLAHECGDVVALSKEQQDRLRSVALLPAVVAGVPVGRGDEEITLFKSVGTAAQDLASAFAVYEAARHAGAGTDLGDLVALKQF